MIVMSFKTFQKSNFNPKKITSDSSNNFSQPKSKNFFENRSKNKNFFFQKFKKAKKFHFRFKKFSYSDSTGKSTLLPAQLVLKKPKRRNGPSTKHNQFLVKRLKSLRALKRSLHLTVQKVFAVNVSVRRSHSNVFLTVSGRNGRVFKVFSAGLLGFTNTKKDTPYAAEAVGKAVARYLLARRDFSIRVIFLSPLDGRLRAVLRGLGSFSTLLKFTSIKSSFVPAHNGCRPKKARRA